MYKATWDKMGWQTQICYTIERGEGMDPVSSCEGLGDPAHFYLEGVWCFSSLVAIMLFYLGVQIRSVLLVVDKINAIQ